MLRRRLGFKYNAVDVDQLCCWSRIASSDFFSLGSPVFLTPKNMAKFHFNQNRRPTLKPAKVDMASSLSVQFHKYT